MPRTRLTIGQSMTLVAIVAVDCLVVRLVLSNQGLGGWGAVWLAQSLGWVILLFARGRLSEFAAWFAGALSLSLVALLVGRWLMPGLVETMAGLYSREVIGRVPASVLRFRMQITFDPQGVVQTRLSVWSMLACEIALSLPVLAFGLFCGLAGLLISRRDRPNPAIEAS